MSSPDLHRIYKASDVLLEVIEFMNEKIQDLEVLQACKEVFGPGQMDRDYLKDIDYLSKSMDQVAEVYFYLVNNDHPVGIS